MEHARRTDRHITAERCALICTKMAFDPHVALFQDLHGNLPYIRIRFGGAPPTLTVQREQQAVADEWGEYLKQGLGRADSLA
jgi:hypothetical protein